MCRGQVCAADLGRHSTLLDCFAHPEWHSEQFPRLGGLLNYAGTALEPRHRLPGGRFGVEASARLRASFFQVGFARAGSSGYGEERRSYLRRRARKTPALFSAVLTSPVHARVYSPVLERFFSAEERRRKDANRRAGNKDGRDDQEAETPEQSVQKFILPCSLARPALLDSALLSADDTRAETETRKAQNFAADAQRDFHRVRREAAFAVRGRMSGSEVRAKCATHCRFTDDATHRRISLLACFQRDRSH